MVPDSNHQKRNLQARSKVKTGCSTCKIRKVKCDETKPACSRCTKTGRQCDGYQTRFKDVSKSFAHSTEQRDPSIRTPSSVVTVGSVESAKRRPQVDISFTRGVRYGQDDIDRLNHYFSTKSLFDVDLDCSREAKEILESSLTDPLVRAAIASLVLLREDLETVGDDWISTSYPTANYHYGLEQYNLALRGLTRNISGLDAMKAESPSPNPTSEDLSKSTTYRQTSPTTQGLRSLLLCCQLFISIEQVRKNYAAIGQHIMQGLNILSEYRVRPGFISINKLMPAQNPTLPLLDIFIIKFFAAPCPFSDADNDGSLSTTPSSCPRSLDGVRSPSNDSFMTDVRTELTNIADMTVKLLNKVSQVETLKSALHLLVEKSELLELLDKWLLRLNDLEKGWEQLRPRLVSTGFLYFFHQTLKIILLTTLDHSPDLNTAIVPENKKLQLIADDIGERVKAYVTHTGVKLGSE